MFLVNFKGFLASLMRVSRLFEQSFKGVLESVKGSFIKILKVFKRSLKAFKGCIKAVLFFTVCSVFQKSFKVFFRKIKDVSEKFHGCFKNTLSACL